MIAELCLLLDQYFTGVQGLFPAWAKGLVLVAALAVIVATLAVRVKEG